MHADVAQAAAALVHLAHPPLTSPVSHAFWPCYHWSMGMQQTLALIMSDAECEYGCSCLDQRDMCVGFTAPQCNSLKDRHPSQDHRIKGISLSITYAC